MQLPLYTLIRF